jgi:hypothetical protein
VEIPLSGGAIMADPLLTRIMRPLRRRQLTIPVLDVAWTRELYEMFAPIRQEARTMDEAEIDALIDEAVDEVRSQGDD